MKKIGREKKIPPFYNIISEKEVQQQRSNIFMVKVHFLTHFDTRINKFLYLQYLDRFGYFSFFVHWKIHHNAESWCSVSTCIELPLINDYFNAKIK